MNTTATEPMPCRTLAVTEWDLVRPEFERRNVPMPSPELASIFGHFNKLGELDAFVVCQFKLHCEPVCSVNPHAVGSLINYARKELLLKGLEGLECYVCTRNQRVRELAWSEGFRPHEEMFVMRLGESAVMREKREKRELANQESQGSQGTQGTQGTQENLK